MEAILKKYALLKEGQKKEVEDFIDFLLQRYKVLKPKVRKNDVSQKGMEDNLFEGWAGKLKGLKDEDGNLFTGVSLQHYINDHLR